MKPLVSIITPAYNAERFLEQTIRSVQAQSFAGWQMIIVNDGSTDNTKQIADQHAANDKRIIVLHRHTSGGLPAIPRNMALQHATGRYIAFLDADDLWLPQKLEQQLQFMQNRNAAISHTAYRRINETGIILSEIKIAEKNDYSDLLLTNCMACLTVVVDRQQTGNFFFDEDVSLKGSEDYGLWLKLAKKTGIIHGLNQVLAEYRVITGSISRNKWNMAKSHWRALRRSANLNMFSSVFYMFSWAFYGYLRNRK